MEKVMWFLTQRRTYAALGPVLVLFFGDEIAAKWGDVIEKGFLVVSSVLAMWSLVRPKLGTAFVALLALVLSVGAAQAFSIDMALSASFHDQDGKLPVVSIEVARVKLDSSKPQAYNDGLIDALGSMQRSLGAGGFGISLGYESTGTTMKPDFTTFKP